MTAPHITLLPQEFSSLGAAPWLREASGQAASGRLEGRVKLHVVPVSLCHPRLGEGFLKPFSKPPQEPPDPSALAAAAMNTLGLSPSHRQARGQLKQLQAGVQSKALHPAV